MAPSTAPSKDSAMTKQSSESSCQDVTKKRRRRLIKKHQLQQSEQEAEQQEMTTLAAPNGPGHSSSLAIKKPKKHLIKKHQREQEDAQQAMVEGVQWAQKKSQYNQIDISRGKEKVPVPLRDPKGKGLPKDYLYINANVVFQSAHVGISLARVGEDDHCRNCVGNCLDNRTPCECTRLTNGEYAYTVEGCLYPHFLKRELERKKNVRSLDGKARNSSLAFCEVNACPLERNQDGSCNGHIQRRFIKECWEKCGCTQLCGNRIVQRGISRKLEVFWTEGGRGGKGQGKGWGVRTLEHLPAGAFVCEYVGEILTNTEMWYRNKDVYGKDKRHAFGLNLDADWCSEKILKDEEALVLDGNFLGNVSRFINHRCGDSSLFELPVEIESPDHHYYHVLTAVALFTSREVKANEELTWDYNMDFNDREHQVQAFECLCGSSLCRGRIREDPVCNF